MKEWAISIVTNPIVVNAVAGAVAALVVALVGVAVVWIKQRTPAALVDKAWIYLKPIVGAVWEETRVAVAREGTISEGWKQRMVEQMLAVLAAEWEKYEAKKLDAGSLAAAREELAEAIDRAAGHEV